ncbi:MAG: hypothetical protein COB14_03385 [Alphaproteobacteria bacterium]|nr:MAG: hypothetical protein COB14_03385 [Alphaproteobacteria bacterium]
MIKRDNKILISTFLLAGAAVGLSSCSSIETEAKYPSGYDRGATGGDIYGKRQTIMGEDGLKLFGGGKKKSGAGESGIGVNSFLWRATLDTVSFMPLASADPFGGVILTDWYTDPNSPNERVKINAFIMGRELKADGVRVRTFRQEIQGSAWRDVPVSEETSRKLEDSILTRARQLRITHLANEE